MDKAVRIGAVDAEVESLVDVVRAVAGHLHRKIKAVTPRIAALLRRDMKKKRRAEAKDRKAGKVGKGAGVAAGRRQIKKRTSTAERLALAKAAMATVEEGANVSVCCAICV